MIFSKRSDATPLTRCSTENLNVAGTNIQKKRELICAQNIQSTLVYITKINRREANFE